MCAVAFFTVAATVVQATQCPGGSECSSDYKPKQVLSLLQTKLQSIALEGDGGEDTAGGTVVGVGKVSGGAKAVASEVHHGLKALGDKKAHRLGNLMTNPSAMLTELEGMVHSGETPAFELISAIKNLILDDIIPCLQTSQDEAAEDLADALDAMELCNNVSKARGAEIEGDEQVSVNNKRSIHAACRDAEEIKYEHNLTNNDSWCVKLGEFLNDPPQLEIPEDYTREESVQYVKDMSEECDKKVTELSGNCTLQEEELAAISADCAQKQDSFELAFCTWKTEVELNCQTLDTCYSTANRTYTRLIEKLKGSGDGGLEEKWRTEEAALNKILCFCNVWLSTIDERDNRSQHNATAFEACTETNFMPASQTMREPAVKSDCPLDSVANHPGTSGFITQEYSSFIDFVKEVISCSRWANSCNAATPPENGAIGTCTDTLASGSTCQPTCNSGYVASGSSSCTMGTLTEATCDEATKCGANEKVVDHACVACPAGKTSTGSHDSSGPDTTCQATLCGVHEKVSGHECVACPAGKTNSPGGDDASGSDTTCQATLCGVHEKVSGHECVACPAGKANSPGGDDASGSDTTCQAAFLTGDRVQLIPGSRYDHETCACAELKLDIFEFLPKDSAPWNLIEFEDGRNYKYQYQDLQFCVEDSAYIEVTSGSCTHVTSRHVCSNAACKLGFADFTAVDDELTGSSDHPPYCYMDTVNGVLKFNGGTNTGTCSDDHKCACEA